MKVNFDLLMSCFLARDYFVFMLLKNNRIKKKKTDLKKYSQEIKKNLEKVNNVKYLR